MVLSAELINQFVKATKDTETKKSETIVYGTAKDQNGTMFVQFDGSTLMTPVISTADTKDGDRVTVMIKNHTAIITGNVSSPSARTDDVKDIKTDVDVDLSGVKRELINQGNQVTAQSKLITEHGQFLTSLESRADTQEATVKDIKDVVDMIETVAKEHDMDVRDIFEHMSWLVNKVTDSMVNDIETRLTHLRNDIGNLTTTHTSDIMTLTVKTDSLFQSRDVLLSEIGELKNRVAVLEAKK